MSIPLPNPPYVPETPLEVARWFETLVRKVRGQVSTSGDAAATIPSASTYHGVTALSAPRTLTLPDASTAGTLTDGDELIVQDESGSAGAQTITIAAAGTDTINGGASVTITTAYGRRRLIRRGAGKWFSA